MQEYFTLKGDYQIKLAECETLCREQETVINSIAAQNAGKTELEKTASKYAGCSELTKEMIDCLIERIEIFEKGRMQITFRYEDLIVSVTGKGETASAGRCIE